MLHGGIASASDRIYQRENATNGTHTEYVEIVGRYGMVELVYVTTSGDHRLTSLDR